MRRNAVSALACVAVLCVLWCKSAGAYDTIPPDALSTSSAILGAEGLYAGALPPPGFYLIDYTLYYHAGELKGRHGREVNGPPFTDFEAWALANVIRPIYVANTTILGANPAWHMVIPIVHKSLSSDFFDQDKTGLGDIYVSPLILAWHSPPWHYAAGLDVIVPTGKYHKGDVTNIGNNHWTFEPAFALSYIGESGFVADTKLMYDIHTEDHALDYQEGQQFHLDYNVGYCFGAQKQWRAGLCGYYLTSLENDKFKGKTIGGSKEKVFAIGPTLSYQPNRRLSIEVKVQKELMAQNRPEGVAAWLKLIFAF
jgi:hypothetical protein